MSTNQKRFKHLLKGIFLVALSPFSSFADEKTNVYEGQLNISGVYGNKGTSYGEADLWIPLAQQWDKTLFLDVRGIKGESATWEGNFGFGYRWLSDDTDRLYGLYSFYDRRHSNLNNLFQQVTVGGELKTLNWSVVGNYYQPVGKTAYAENNYDQFQWGGTLANGYQNLFISNGYERALGGGDIEMGRVIPFISGLRGYAGYFYFDNVQLSQPLQGPRIRLEYQLDQLVTAWKMNSTVIEASWQQDPLRGNIVNVGVRWILPLGNTTAPSSNASSHMTDYVHRDVNIVSAITHDSFAAHSTNGVATNFAHVNTATSFLDEVQKSHGADVVILNENININQAVSTRDNIIITGQNFEYKPNILSDVSEHHHKASITSKVDNDLFMIGKNTTIRDLSLNVSKNYSAVKNVGESVGHLTLENLTTNGNIVVETADNSTGSILNIRHNTLNLKDGDNLIGFKIINKSGSQVIEDFSNNTVNFNSGNYNQGYLINNNLGFQTIYFIEDNRVNFASSTQGSTGFSVNNSGELQQISNFYANTVNFEGGANNTGLTLYNHKNSTVPKNNGQTVSKVNMNSFTFGDSSQQANAIYIENMGLKQTIGTVDNNAITIGAGQLNEAIKIFNDHNNQTIQSISNNQINFAGAQSNAEVLDMENFGVSQTVQNLSGNTFNFQEVTDSTGLDINNNINQQTVENLNNNTFNLSGSVNNFKAINLQNTSADGASIIINGMMGNRLLSTETAQGVVVNASATSTIEININGEKGLAVPLEAVSLNNHQMPVQDMKSGGAVVVTERVK